MGKDKTTINLLPKKQEGLFEQFLAWSLTVGRLLIILTETIALGTFLYRFGLDMKIVDLHDQIKANSFIVQNFAPEEKTFRNLQTRITLAKKADEASASIPTIFHDIIKMAQGKITFQNILIANELIRIQAQAASVSDLANFVSSLKGYSAVRSLSVDNVEDKPSKAAIVVSITAYLKTDNTFLPTPTPDMRIHPNNYSE